MEDGTNFSDSHKGKAGVAGLTGSIGEMRIEELSNDIKTDEADLAAGTTVRKKENAMANAAIAAHAGHVTRTENPPAESENTNEANDRLGRSLSRPILFSDDEDGKSDGPLSQTERSKRQSSRRPSLNTQSSASTVNLEPSTQSSSRMHSPQFDEHDDGYDGVDYTVSPDISASPVRISATPPDDQPLGKKAG